MAHADDLLPDSEKTLFANLVEDLSLPSERAKSILDSAKSVSDEELDAVMENMRGRSFTQKCSFFFDLTRMMDADKSRHDNEIAALDAIFDSLKVEGDDRILAHGLAEAMAKSDSAAAAKLAMSSLFGKEIVKMLTYFITGWAFEPKQTKVDLLLARGMALPSDGTMAEPYTNSGFPQEVVLKKSGIRMAFIPAGTFRMGSPDGVVEANEHPQHEVTFSSPFHMGIFPITQAQWKAVMGAEPSAFKAAGKDAPVENVSWTDCQNFCLKLCGLEGIPEGGFRMPTEAQWEYACRAETATAYPFGNAPDLLGDHAWFSENSGGIAHSVSRKKPNAWGFHDMLGNVWEWCHDWYGSYSKGKVESPMGPASGLERVRRGGSWIDSAERCCSTSRGSYIPGYCDCFLGFRLVTAPIQ